MRGALITVAAQKGGVGKTTIAYELASALSATLVDLDFHGGGATSMWGFDPRSAVRAPLLDALEHGTVPRPKHRPNRADLVPSHPDLSAARFDADDIADALLSWSEAWGPTPIIIDTHPGDHWTTNGALQVADLVVVPVPPGRRETSALEEMLHDHRDFQILLVPNMVPPVAREWWIDKLEAFCELPNVHLAPPISEHRWLRHRAITTPVTRQPHAGQRVLRAAEQLRAVAATAAQLCQTPIAA